MATINNADYSWSMIEVSSSNTVLNSIAPYISAIKWNTKRNTKVNYGLGGKPIGVGFGNIEYTASITLNYNGLQQLRAALIAAGEDPEAGLVCLGSFDVIISWIDDLSAGLGTNHTITLKDCFFNEDGLEVNQDDTNLTKELDLNPFRIVNAILP